LAPLITTSAFGRTNPTRESTTLFARHPAGKRTSSDPTGAAGTKSESSLWREVDASQKFSEPRIRPKVVEFWIDFQHIKPPGVLLTCLSQQLKGFLAFTEASSVQGLLVRVVFDQLDVLFQLTSLP
jgi:hypothetical protein